MAENLSAAKDVQGLMSEIREFIFHPRRRHPIINDTPNWNMLASAMDLISDTEMAINTYEHSEETDTGMLYLLVFGLLQAMYVQQDALQNLVNAFERNDKYKIKSEPEAELIRSVRNRAIGHPTKEGGTKPKKDGSPGEQLSYVIVRNSLSTNGFKLACYSNLRDTEFIDFDASALIDKNRTLATRVLDRTKTWLHEIEMEHRKEFRGEKLAEIFPGQMDYYFEKVYSGIYSPSDGNSYMAESCLGLLSNAFTKFKEALEKRGSLNDESSLPHEVREAEYPLYELRGYFKGVGSLKDPRAAAIFVHFLKFKMRELLNIASEIDQEYEGDVTKENEKGDVDAVPIRIVITDVEGKEVLPPFPLESTD